MSTYPPTKTTRAGGRERSALLRPSADTREPTAHAPSHKHGGTDEVATAAAKANGIPKAGSAGQLASAWFPLATPAVLGVVKQAAADADTARGTVTAASAPAGADTIDRAVLNTNLTTMRNDVHTELSLLHTELNDLKAKLRTAGILAT